MKIQNALQVLRNRGERATENLSAVRTQIEEQFKSNYVVGSHAMEALIAAQHSTQIWAQITRILDQGTTEEQVQGLRNWATQTTDNIIECGRSMSTSLVASAVMMSEEDEKKRVLQAVKQLISHVDALD